MSDADFLLTTTLAATPSRLYQAWLDADQHAAMTGAAASSEPREGGAFTAWEGYIEGRYLALEPGRRIRMAWRTSEFPAGAPDSEVEVRFQEGARGTELTLSHRGAPPEQAAAYRQGWEDYYFAPMRAWLAGG